MTTCNSIVLGQVSTTATALDASRRERTQRCPLRVSARIAASCCALLAWLLLPMNVAQTATVFTNPSTSGANWNIAGNWDNGLPAGGNPGTIGASRIAIANAALSTADITVSSGGTLRLLTVGNVANSVLVQSGGILQHEGTNPGGTAITFLDGARIGKNVSNNAAATANSILVPANGTLFANGIRGDGRVDNGFIGLTLTGVLSAGNINSVLHVQPTAATDAPLNINPTATNNPFNGTAIVEGGAGAPGYLILQGTGALVSASAVDVRSGGVLRFESSTNAIGLATVSIGNGRRVEWNGTSSYTGTPLNLDLQDGANLGKWRANSVGIVNETLTIAANSTAYASFIRGDGRVDDQAITLRVAGALAGVGTSVLRIQPDASITANASAALDIVPTALTNPFAGSVVAQGNASGARGILGVGNGALLNATSLSINSGGTLRFLGNSLNPFDLSKIPSVTISSGARAEWHGTNTYTGTPVTLNMTGGSFMGKHVSNSTGTSRETINFGAGTVTVDEIGNDRSYSSLPGVAEDRALFLRGALSSVGASRLLVQPSLASALYRGPLVIDPTAVGGNTGLTGTVEVLGKADASMTGVLMIRGTNPLGDSDVIVGQGGLLDVRVNSLSNVESVALAGNGQIRFRNNSGSTLSNTLLSGNGFIRSESLPTAVSNNLLDNTAALQSLALNAVQLVADNAAGTLTFQTTTLSVDAASTLHMELGATQNDLLAVQGNLNLLAMPELELSDLGDLAPGVYTIASYTGALTGEFSAITNLTNLIFLGIDYGTGTNSLITVEFAPQPAPEPSALWLVAAGVGLASVRRRRTLK